MEECITIFSNYMAQLTALGQYLPDCFKAALLLGSLPNSYDTLVTVLESRPEEDITSQFIKSKLIDEYKRRKGAKEMKEDSYSEGTAMKVMHKEKSTYGKKSCFFCKKSGHLKSNWKRNLEEKTRSS